MSEKCGSRQRSLHHQRQKPDPRGAAFCPGAARRGGLSLTFSVSRATRNGASGAGSPTEQAIERFTQFTGQIRRDGVPLGNVVSGQFSYANGLDKVEVIRPVAEAEGRALQAKARG